MFQDASYFVDSTNTLKVNQIQRHFSKFKRINARTLVLKREPNNIWVRFRIKNTGEPRNFFLGLYSQLDTLDVYKKTGQNYQLINSSVYSKPSKIRNEYDLRYHITSILMQKNQEIDLMVKMIDRRHYLNVYADFTTSEDNLVWETGFYGEIGFFSGIFFIIALVCVGMAIFSRKKVFFVYACYLVLLNLLILHEELFISYFKNPVLYNFVYRLNSAHFLLIAMGLNIYLFLDITETAKFYKKYFKPFYRFSIFMISVGMLISVVYFIFYKRLSFGQTLYSLLWDFNIFLLVLSAFVVVVIIALYFIRIKRYLLGVLISAVYLFFNPVVYFFNYSQILDLYEITHPNYFYYMLVLEIFVFGGIIAYQYRNIVNGYIKVLNDKIKLERDNYQILSNQQSKIKQSIVEAQDHLLKDLSKDLHDDIGQKLTVINFSVENLKLNSEKPELIHEIRENILEISDSIRDLSHWLNDFNLGNLNIDEVLENEVQRLKRNNLFEIEFKKIKNPAGNYKTDVTENTLIYRIFQECINNIIKHSKASNVNVTVDFSKKISIEISDNGIGFNPLEKGNGLSNIINRAKIIGFGCEISSEINKGSSIKIYKK